MKKIFVLTLVILNSVAFANRESGGRIGASAVYIDFRSFGTGIDYKAKNKVMGLIAEAGMRGEVIDQESVPRGREGESTECVQLKDANQRYIFIKAIAGGILEDSRQLQKARTVVYVGEKCGDLSSATEQDLSRY